jgi:hypothetical protein
MSSLKGDFMDAQNIVIINDVPHFSMKENTYLAKLKNGLSLDYVFFMEDSAVNADDENFEEKVEESQYQPLKHELFDEVYDIDILPMPRKGKKSIKKEGSTNLKKNKIRQNGFNDKLYTIQSNASYLYYGWSYNECKLYCDDDAIDCDNVFDCGYDYYDDDYYNDNYVYNDDEYDNWSYC